MMYVQGYDRFVDNCSGATQYIQNIRGGQLGSFYLGSEEGPEHSIGSAACRKTKNIAHGVDVIEKAQ